PRAFIDGVRRPRLRGLRLAWGGDLGVTPVDDEVRTLTRTAAEVFRRLGARVEEAHPDFSGLREIVLTSRGVSMVARHEEKLAKWRGVMQENLVKNIDHGLALTPAEIGRAERLRTELWHRVRAFQERYDLILTPTAAVAPFPVAWRSGPKEINGQPMPSYIDWAMVHYADTLVGLPWIMIAPGFHTSVHP